MTEHMVQEIEASCLSEFTEAIMSLKDNLQLDPVHHDIMLFRGQSNKDYELIPSIGGSREFSCAARFSMMNAI